MFLLDDDGDHAGFLPASSVACGALIAMPRSWLGVCSTSDLEGWESRETLALLEQCHELGAAGIHAVINGDPVAIRKRAEESGMYVEAMVPMPDGDDTSEFVDSIQRAQAAGATALRAACLPTRRYEAFQSWEAWQQHVARSHRSIRAALPILDQFRIPLGLENHKDWTTAEMLELMRQYGSEYFGVCLDFGNNISLLDDVNRSIEQLAPYTVSTHLKDVAVEPHTEGFLLAEVVLGDGIVDVPRAVRRIHHVRPQTHFSLEMIVREPLRVPVLSESYWTTFPDRACIDLARTLRLVNQNRLPRVFPERAAAMAACLETRNPLEKEAF
jgi:sugar phosphate isomerase/epimerase